MLAYLGFLTISWLVLNVVYRVEKGFFEKHGFQLYYGFILVYKFASRLGAGSIWRRLSILFIGFYAISLVWFYTFLAEAFVNRLAGGGGLAVLVPGLNITGVDLVYFIIAVSVAAIFHEYFHGKVASSTNTKVKSFGLALVFALPLAFTEVDEEEFQRSKLVNKISILSAGVAANLIIGLVAIVLFNTTVSQNGLLVTGVVPGSLASRAGIQPYSLILGINGWNITSLYDLRSILSNTSITTLNITLLTPEGVVKHLIVYRSTLDKTLGVYVSTPPAEWLRNALGVYYAAQVVKLLFWTYIVNINLAVLNAAPLFITDGGRIIFEFLGSRSRRIAIALNIASLLLLVITLLP
ncbi:M50 family metallopeptidase [Thermogladius sp. 4427co]|uniref:M50 family metallopeptidase n=1 Tax=Thermogladius sp. 4427co TaxID=3450718 RepID=UPI003F79FAC0